MIKCEGEVVTIKGSWKQIMSEYMKLSEAIMIYSDKKYRGGLNPTIPHLMKTFEEKQERKVWILIRKNYT